MDVEIRAVRSGAGVSRNSIPNISYRKRILENQQSYSMIQVFYHPTTSASFVKMM